MRRRWFILGLVVMAGCTTPAARPRHALADTLDLQTATGLAPVDSIDGLGGEQPTVMFRCEGSKVGAYVVTGSLDTLPSEDQMVRIDLESAPDC